MSDMLQVLAMMAVVAALFATIRYLNLREERSDAAAPVAPASEQPTPRNVTLRFKGGADESAILQGLQALFTKPAVDARVASFDARAESTQDCTPNAATGELECRLHLGEALAATELVEIGVAAADDGAWAFELRVVDLSRSSTVCTQVVTAEGAELSAAASLALPQLGLWYVQSCLTN